MSTTVAIRRRIIKRWENQLILLRGRYSFQVNKAYHKSCTIEKNNGRFRVGKDFKSEWE